MHERMHAVLVIQGLLVSQNTYGYDRERLTWQGRGVKEGTHTIESKTEEKGRVPNETFENGR